MNYLERYRDGEFEQVWSELHLLGPMVRQEPHYSIALMVASETMCRVRRNCDLLVARLTALGYVFGVYPDGSKDYISLGPLVPPSNSIREDCAELEERAGDIPLSLKAFWHEVGSVDYVGMHPSWPSGLDPLVVYPPEAAIYDFEEFVGDSNGSDQFQASLSPDDLHKDNISGGSPYSIALPDPNADSVFLNEGNDLLFVQYLRLAILRWGGFPGLALKNSTFEPLAGLIASLEPF